MHAAGSTAPMRVDKSSCPGRTLARFPRSPSCAIRRCGLAPERCNELTCTRRHHITTQFNRLNRDAVVLTEVIL